MSLMCVSSFWRCEMTMSVGRPYSNVPEVNFYILVNRVINEFESNHDVKVSDSARNLLIEQALPYEQHVITEISQGKVTLNFIEKSLMKLLIHTYELASTQNRKEIDDKLIKQSEKDYCPYLFWC
jgi:hypothetical protein